ncbi:hypothetical protein chiPu_0002261 [Chiloscyllium punctatum]|uniref:Uncharacterized protein n=1 Tax=Chiloscyllium punctatum TaxID=137246 RepID=A0A401S0E0_CHIPU|nr:hypothetical protein [Chiloscyllium punctatum]
MERVNVSIPGVEWSESVDSRSAASERVDSQSGAKRMCQFPEWSEANVCGVNVSIPGVERVNVSSPGVEWSECVDSQSGAERMCGFPDQGEHANSRSGASESVDLRSGAE